MSGADLVEKRRPLTKAETIELCVRQNGRCGCGCGKPLNPFTEGVIDEHIIPLELTGSNDLKNRAYYRKPCAVEKTRVDAVNIAKAKRLAGETCSGPSKRPLQGRGFDRTMTKRFNGQVVKRSPKSSDGEELATEGRSGMNPDSFSLRPPKGADA